MIPRRIWRGLPGALASLLLAGAGWADTTVRSGNHPDFGRVVIDVDATAGYQLDQTGDHVTVRLPAGVTLGRPPPTPKNVAGLKTDGAAIELEGGRVVDAEGSWHGAPGTAVVVGVRPDAFTAAADGAFRGRIELVEDLGSLKLLHLEDGRDGFVVAVAPDVELGDATDWSAGVRWKDVHVFEASSGRRV